MTLSFPTCINLINLNLLIYLKYAVPLFHILALNAKVIVQAQFYILWSQLTGITLENHNSNAMTTEKEVPLFLKDVSSLLIQLLYALPLNVDKSLLIFVCVILEIVL